MNAMHVESWGSGERRGEERCGSGLTGCVWVLEAM